MNNLCNSGQLQAPINIKSSKAILCEYNCELLFYYRSSICNILNNSGNIVLNYDPGSYINYKSQVFELDKISFTVPCSNKIDNSNYPMEMLLWHKSVSVGEVLILSVFIDVNEAVSKSKDFFDIFSNDLPQYSGMDKLYNTPEDWNIYHTIPDNKGFYTYFGSLPQSPCTESVIWIVMESPVNMSSKSYKNIKSVIKKNSRKIQKTNGRIVQYNPNNNSDNARNYGSKLRCYTDAELRKTCKCMCNKNKGSTSGTYFSISANLVFILMIILLVSVFIVICVKFGIFNINSLKDFINRKPTFIQITGTDTS